MFSAELLTTQVSQRDCAAFLGAIQAYDSHGKALKDETPASGDESPLEASGWEQAKDPATESR